jgi:acetyltransferase-like isoleucine patch superfamily enzyme
MVAAFLSFNISNWQEIMKSKNYRLHLIQKSVYKARDVVRKSWDRVLPTGDYLSDRWEKAKYLGFGAGSSIYDSSLVIGDVRVGKNTWIGPFTVLDGSGGLVIGDFCSISAGVQIYSHDTVEWAVSGGENVTKYEPTKIGANVYLGPNVIIARGVTIGEGSVIGANSFVNNDIPAHSRAWGNPCVIIDTDLNDSLKTPLKE